MACGVRGAPRSMTDQVFSMAADGSNSRRLTKGSAYNWYPDWQPKP